MHTTVALLSFVEEDLMPLSVVESSSFRAFVKCLDPRYQVSSRKQLSSILLQEHYERLLNQRQRYPKGCYPLKHNYGHVDKSTNEIFYWNNRTLNFELDIRISNFSL